MLRQIVKEFYPPSYLVKYLDISSNYKVLNAYQVRKITKIELFNILL